MDVKTLKLISIPIILVVNFLIGIIPYFLISKRIKKINHKKLQSNSSDDSEVYFVSTAMKRFLTLANFFCGGVFLSTSLIGLYPSVHNKFNDILRKQPSIPEYPYAGLSLAVGFFLVWILEIIVHACIHLKSKSHHHDHPASHNSDKNNIKQNSKIVKVTFNKGDEEISPNFSEKQLLQPLSSDNLLNINECTDDNKCQTSESVQVTVEPNSDEAHSHVPIKGNLLGSVMLTFALGSHSIIEGLGFAMIGEFSMTVNMLITVLIHESVCALSLGVNLASKKTNLVTSLSLLLTFAALIPVGIGIGLAVNLSIEKNLLGDIVTAVLQGAAAGTFIYVVFMEILPSEMLQRKDATLKVLMMIIGFAVIASMKIFHTHGDKPNISSSNCTSNSTNPFSQYPVHRH